jgi:hypothetical protein
VCSQGAHRTKPNDSTRRRRTRVYAHGRHVSAHDGAQVNIERNSGSRARRRRLRHLQETISQLGSMAGITSVSATARLRARTRWRARKARHATSARRPGATRDGGNAELTYGQRGANGEGVREEGLDAVVALCSEIEEGGGVRGDPVRLLPHGRPRLGEGRRRRAPTDGQPRLLLLLHSSYVSSGGLGKGKPQLARV